MTHEHEPQGPKPITVIFNLKAKTVEKETVSWEEIINYGFDNNPPIPVSEASRYTITYERGHDGDVENTLAQGMPLKLKDGMIVNVSPTRKS